MTLSKLDHVADKSGIELHRYSKLYEIPAFVKSADFDTTWQPKDLPATSYGDPRTQQFPCHSAASTWLSCLYFQEKRAEMHTKNAEKIESRLSSYAKYWGISSSVGAVKVAHAEMNKNADDKLPDSSFAYVWTGDNGHRIRKLRMANSLEVKAAADWLQRHRDEIPFADRNTIAGKILMKQAEFGVSLGDCEQFVERQAGRGFCDPKEVQQMLIDRSRLAKTAEVREHLQQMAEVVKNKPRAALGPQSLVKLAATVDMFDRHMNLLGKYSDTIRRPDDVLFRITIKEARDGLADACAMTSGTVYDRTHFKRVKLADVQALFGKDFANEVSGGLDISPEKLAEVASTLPLPDAETFDRFMTESGIEPIQKHAADARGGVPAAVLDDLATSY